MTKTKLALATALAVITSASLAGQSLAASRTHRAAQSEELINRPVALPYSYSGEDFNRYSGPFRTDASPNSGGS
jgi:hypothetical protein